MKMKHISLVWCVVFCLLLAACGNKKGAQEENTQKQVELDRETGNDKEAAPEDEKADSGIEADGGGLPAEPRYGAQIEGQCFDVNLKPLGDVRFVSYEPDADKIPLLDAGFVIETAKNEHGKDIMLPGWTDDNIRENYKFDKVQAVSFSDIESDGYDDIIIICDYQVMEGNAGKGSYTEVRIYSGSADGTFTLNRGLSDSANATLMEKTIGSVKGVLGSSRTASSTASKSWQEIYMGYLSNNADDAEGYTLIYLDSDNVPELVQVGNCEAAGCKIISIADGQIQETQLKRLNFTYLEREGLLCNSDGLMDNYYDVVWQMNGGRMRQIASGWWGFEDNSNPQFDENGSPIYRYFWEEREMSSEEYTAALNSVFDCTREKGYDYESLDLRWEMMERLKKSING